MHTTVVSTTLLLSCSIPGLAAQNHVYAPDNAAIAQPNATAIAWRDSPTGFRSQFVYDTSHFLNVGVTAPCVITRMRFRAANAATSAGGSFPGDGVTTGITIDIGTATSDYSTATTTFATNRGFMQNVMTLGTLVCAPAAGTSPNTQVLDIPIPGGFLYDPTAGLDLIIDITGPDFVGTLPSFASESTFLLHRCSSVTAIGSTTAAGLLSANCPVVLFDILGPGGIPDDGSGSPVLVQSASVVYGTGCGPTLTRSVAELFPGLAGSSLDLGSGITFVPDVPGAPSHYTIVSGTTPYRPRSGSPLTNSTGTGVLGEDQVSGPLALPFTFPYVGGATSVVHADSNGYVVLTQTSVNGGDSGPSLSRFTSGTIAHSGLPRVFPCWFDFNAARNISTNPGSGVYFDVDAPAGRAWITYENIGEFAINTPGAKLYNFQVEFAADGTIEFRYGSMSPFGGATPKIVGFTPGATSVTPTSTNLSAAMPLVTGSIDQRPLALAGTAPRIGSPLTLHTTWVPAPGVVLNWIAATQINPGLDLAGLGITGGCSAYMDPGSAIVQSVQLGLGSVDYTLSIPDSLAFAGFAVVAQSACFSSFNPFGLETSNGLRLDIGTVF